MTLDQMILAELKKVDLNGITVLSVICELGALRIVFEIPPAKVEFTVNDDYQFQILSVNYKGVMYNDFHYLAQFDGFVIDVITKIRLIETKKRAEYEELKQQKLKQYDENLILNQGRLKAILLREEKIREQERQFDLKEQEIKDREKILYDKEVEIAQKRQEEELELEEKRLKNRKKFKDIVLIQKFKRQKDNNNLER